MAARCQNQFGRLPLHYALDRCRVNFEVVRNLLEVYPEGAGVLANDFVTPYDLCIKWNHPNKICYLLLQAEPLLDVNRFMRLKYGPLLGSLYNFFRSTPRELTPGDSSMESDLTSEIPDSPEPTADKTTHRKILVATVIKE